MFLLSQGQEQAYLRSTFIKASNASLSHLQFKHKISDTRYCHSKTDPPEGGKVGNQIFFIWYQIFQLQVFTVLNSFVLNWM